MQTQLDTIRAAAAGKAVDPYRLWSRVCYESMARDIAKRCNEENPKANAHIGYHTEGADGEDQWLVWIRPVAPFIFLNVKR